ncbi:non-canonical purine NTP pyrophosphatase, RdgB/HAM1 family [Leptospira inadai serovar Lyme str. 10]|uniref:dITP/XTP pyrophosphatase n=2 Tax=Leptospira inadai serovar Lyme TaxID=293084 RepID=V6HSN5_9LEPT|nr:RdgB/HAM1 family non-canonical purine NTP pyrophosphatase [Leptospira inadai]EQA35634.1 non-canonical purine NTP pyrophosphatase, RdgB/HAM1 family [Leptospira inadai serovar Lyme str. 10]PNV74165.1 non-canonical purine NTP pyrophosphatase, RdgB/HAM1 family [Leptospira inadai serovar Lyme]
MKSLVIASNNAHKIREIRSILSPLGIELKTPRELGIECDPEETGTTFQENALLKARELYSLSGLPSLADDSGICVEALSGEPGIHSARFGGEGLDDEGRARLLLERMQGKENRDAKYVCVIALVDGDSESTFEGECRGKIAEDYDRTGFGFGYDPVFYFPPFQVRFSQVSEERKNTISHRRVALDRLVSYLKANLQS